MCFEPSKVLAKSLELTDDRMVFESVLSEIGDEMENDDEKDDTDSSQSLLTSEGSSSISSVPGIFFLSLSSINYDHFRVLDSANLVQGSHGP
ncbi:hypothetical protein AVEN_128604-1 [Araneus ventricosus]|uniref:Uncharacterized protein n=1 Tax=Araneus ventricosus TaxID=182803 RepID=A0A4Y2RC05_ARAVE|nr:hypothetical protein AVEN_128604-1 [Araneus ventricosus]